MGKTKAKERELETRQAASRTSSEGDEEEQFVVTRILAVRPAAGPDNKRELLVQWADVDGVKQEDSWEPEDNVPHGPELDAFRRRMMASLSPDGKTSPDATPKSNKPSRRQRSAAKHKRRQALAAQQAELNKFEAKKNLKSKRAQVAKLLAEIEAAEQPDPAAATVFDLSEDEDEYDDEEHEFETLGELHERLTRGRDGNVLKPGKQSDSWRAREFLNLMSRQKTASEKRDQLADIDLLLNEEDEGDAPLSRLQRIKAEREFLKAPTVPRARNFEEWSERWHRRAAEQTDWLLRKAATEHAQNVSQVGLAHGWAFAERYLTHVMKSVRDTQRVEISVVHGMAYTATKLAEKARKAAKKRGQ